MSATRKQRHCTAGTVVALGLLLCAPGYGSRATAAEWPLRAARDTYSWVADGTEEVENWQGPQAEGRTPVSTTPRFAFYSDLQTNVNDALIQAGLARNDGAPELFQSGAEQPCFEGLAPSVRAGWDRAVDYYAEIISPSAWDERAQYLLRLDLAGFDEGLRDARAQQFVGLAAHFRAAATPAYEACRWTSQDEANRRWISEVSVLLSAHEDEIADRLARLYRKPWDGLPIPVDVVETVDEQGANSIIRRPAGGHLLVSRSYRGQVALEIVFHEASHLLMGRGDPLQQALDEAAASLNVPVPDGLWHVVLFYTTGETVRRVLAESGEPEYRPLLYEIFERSSWVRYKDALESTWPAYLDGERTPSQAATDLIRAIVEPRQP